MNAPTKYLLDTCICVFLLRNKYDINVMINNVGMENCYISEVTIAELKYGDVYGKLKNGANFKVQGLDKFLSDINVLPISPVYDLYAEEKARLRIGGMMTGDFDLLIGVTAVKYGMVMVTQNVKDFKNIRNIQIENWIPEK